MELKEIKRGDLYYADLRPIIGSEQGGVRPVLIIQNDVGNHFSPTVIAASITSRQRKHRLPTHVFLPISTEGLRRNSIVLLEQVRTIDRSRLGDYILYTFLDDYDLSGKTIAPFNTSGGSGFSGSLDTIEEMEPEAELTEGLSLGSSEAENCTEAVSQWLEEIGMAQ